MTYRQLKEKLDAAGLSDTSNIATMDYDIMYDRSVDCQHLGIGWVICGDNNEPLKLEKPQSLKDCMEDEDL